MIVYKYLSVIFFIVLFGACKTKQVVEKGNNSVSKNEKLAEKLVDSLVSSALKYNDLYLKFSASVKSGKQDFSSVGTARLLKDSVLLISITPMLGIELMRARITKSEIIVLNRLNKTYFLQDMKEINKLFGINLTFSHLERIITNQIFTYSSEISVQKDYKFLESNENGSSFSKFVFYGTISDTMQYTHSLWIRNAEKVYNSFQVDLPKTKKSLVVNYSNFQQIFSVMFPYLIKIETIDKQNVTNLELEILKFEKDNNSNFAFSIPKNYKKIKALGF